MFGFSLPRSRGPSISILLTDEALSAELLRMTDSFTDELFRLDTRVMAIMVEVSRSLEVLFHRQEAPM